MENRKEQLAIKYMDLEREVDNMELELNNKKKILKQTKEDYFLLLKNQEQTTL